MYWTIYVSPDPERMHIAYQAGNVALNPGSGAVNLVFTNYAQPGDKLNVDSFMGEAKDKITLQVEMGSLPDGTNYPAQTVLGASAKQLTVTTTNSNYQKL